MGGQGFIKLYRQLREHHFYLEKRRFSKYEAWIDLIFMANHKANKVLLGSQVIEVERGQFITSVRKLCEKWDWSNTKVRQFLELLKVEGMIDFKSDTKKTVITLVNYGVYNDYDETKTPQKHHENDAKTSQKHTNKNDKNDKNDEEEKEDIYTSIFEHWNSQEIIVHKKLSADAKKNIKATFKENDNLDEWLVAISNYKKIYEGKEYYFTYKWDLADFMKYKNAKRFLDIAEPFKNFSTEKGATKNGKNGNAKELPPEAEFLPF